MNIKDQIRAEIERLKAKCRKDLIKSSHHGLIAGKIEAYNELLLFIDSLPEQPVECLEETADLLAIAHLQGMEQQKAKMMEDAVEGEIQMRYSGCLCAKTIRAINEDKFKLGDKVKVIVIKED